MPIALIFRNRLSTRTAESNVQHWTIRSSAADRSNLMTGSGVSFWRGVVRRDATSALFVRTLPAPDRLLAGDKGSSAKETEHGLREARRCRRDDGRDRAA